MNKAQVVIQTAFLGDLILTIPFLNQVKKIAPDQKLIIVCRHGLGSFLKNQGVVDDFIEIKKSDRQSYSKAKHDLKAFTINQLYCIHRSFRSILFSYQIKAQKKIGFKSFLGFFVFDEMAKYKKKWPDAIRKFNLISSVNNEVKSALNLEEFEKLNYANSEGLLPPIPILFSFSRFEKIEMKANQVCIFPGSVWATKRWTVQGFTEVAQVLIAKGYKIILLGGPDEKDICDQIAAVVPDVKVLAGQLSINQSIEIVKNSNLVIANDSAATHMAAFQGTPVVTIFGPTTLDFGFRPWSDLSRVIQIDDLKCRPCGLHGHHKCPLGHHNCMKLISSNLVIQKSLELLQR